VKQIKSALISVFYKDGLDEIVKQLASGGVTLYSTGGTQKFIESLGEKCVPVESLTGYPSILGGRVKTLHPSVFGGILARRENESDHAQLKQYNIPEIDLVIVDLYPFEETVASGAGEQDIIEKIDIGGISLIRAAAKNFADTVIIASKNQYSSFLEILKNQNNATSIEQRRHYAAEAFNVSSSYDSAIFGYFNIKEEIPALKLTESRSYPLRYGENPHQKAAFFGDLDSVFEKLHGKEISYNNLLDIDSALNLISEYQQTTFAILKHNNACGIASRPTVAEAWDDALKADPVSAFGGVLTTNSEVDKAAAEKINTIFFEVILAPSYTTEALEILETKKNRIILRTKERLMPEKTYRSMLGGIAVQERDSKVGGIDSDIRVATKRTPTESEVADLLFANKVVKNSKSNSIVLAKDGMLLASGVGQTSRVDALKQAIEKAKSFGFDLHGAVMASDAFFPFPDCVEIAHNEGIDAVIQPGGSVRDGETEEFCNANDMVMLITGMRHFRH